MDSLTTELIKLRRSTSWGIALLLPIIMVAAGGGSTWATDGFVEGWHTLWVRSIGFYTMAVLAVGLAVLASLVWRVEHQGSNWNTLMSRPVPTWQIVAAKTISVAVLAAVMQLVLVVAVVAVGVGILDLPGMLPARYLATSGLIVIACVPVCALQSALSAFSRSFALPVAAGLALAGVGTMSLLMHVPGAAILPQALLTRTALIGAFSSAGETTFEVQDLSAAGAVTTIGLSVTLTAIIIAATARVLDRSDTRC